MFEFGSFLGHERNKVLILLLHFTLVSGANETILFPSVLSLIELRKHLSFEKESYFARDPLDLLKFEVIGEGLSKTNMLSLFAKKVSSRLAAQDNFGFSQRGFSQRFRG